MNFIKFLGTAGARFTMISQLRYSAGIWLHYQSTDIIIDPGPGTLLRCRKSKPSLNLSQLDALILTHKHLDHSGDVNVMIEAMTNGGFSKRGLVLVPGDSLGHDGVILPYIKKMPRDVVELKSHQQYRVKEVEVIAAVKNIHSVETYGLKLVINDKKIGFISDTKYFKELIDVYKDCAIIVANVVFNRDNRGYNHFCKNDFINLSQAIRPRLAIATHFGMNMLRAKPHLLEKEIQKELPFVKFAYDGYTLNLDKYMES
jgi:ribonuclease BN (tRNA processing enzyme)